MTPTDAVMGNSASVAVRSNGVILGSQHLFSTLLPNYYTLTTENVAFDDAIGCHRHVDTVSVENR